LHDKRAIATDGSSFINPYLSVFSEAVAAIDWSVVSGLEWHLSPRPALRAYGIEHFAGLPPVAAAAAVAVSLFCHTAVLAAHRFICKPLLSKEFLIAYGKNKLFAAVFASQCFVLVHSFLTRILLEFANQNGSLLLFFYKEPKIIPTK
jgi:hypothetical protein